jgi:hypothetical protein
MNSCLVERGTAEALPARTRRRAVGARGYANMLIMKVMLIQTFCYQLGNRLCGM